MACQRCLEIQKCADRRFRINLVVSDLSDRESLPTHTCFLVGSYGGDIYVNIDSEISATFLYRIPKIAITGVAIFSRVAGNNEATAPPHKLVDPQILEMTTVGKVHVPACIIRLAEQLEYKIKQADGGIVPPFRIKQIESGITEPRPEPDIEYGHQECQRG